MVMADRIVILNAGRIAQIGTPEEIYNRPVSPFVAANIAAVTMLPLPLLMVAILVFCAFTAGDLPSRR
jgi:ABC-type sugar transport system ATPase subunit